VRRIAALVLLLVSLSAPAALAAGPAATQRALARQMRFAGPASGALAVDLDSGTAIYAARADVPRIPASVEKLYTTATALRTLGADGRLVTQVAAAVPRDGAGTLDGDIAAEPRGAEGFGYDPVFVPAGEELTVAELGNDWKALNSHRAQAARALLRAVGAAPATTS